MNVGIVTDFYYPWIGGPATAVRSLAHGLSGRGHDVSILAPSMESGDKVEKEGRISVWRAATSPLPFGYNVRVGKRPFRSAGAWLASNDFDLIQVHHPFPLSFAAARMARARGLPVLATNHTVPECSLWGLRNAGPLYRGAMTAFSTWLRYSLGVAHEVSTPTATARSRLVELGYGGTIQVISNGVDTDRFQPDSPDDGLRNRLGLDHRPVVLYMGRLDAEKQMDVWVRAAARVARECDAQFVIGGEGTDRPGVEALVQRLGLSGCTKLVGYLPDSDYPAIYRLAQIFFITSPVELQSIATLEAIASGLPVVGVRAGALPELVRDDYNGCLVAPGNDDEAAQALIRLLGHNDMRHRFGEASRSLALLHDLRGSIEAYEQWFTTCVRSHYRESGVERALAPGK